MKMSSPPGKEIVPPGKRQKVPSPPPPPGTAAPTVSDSPAAAAAPSVALCVSDTPPPQTSSSGKDDLEAIRKNLEQLAGDPEHREVWESWASFLLQEQTSLASREKPFTSVFLSSGAVQQCIDSVLSQPLIDTHNTSFHTILKSFLINNLSLEEGQPDLVDHIHARLHQLSLYFRKTRGVAVGTVGQKLSDDELTKFCNFSEKITLALSNAVSALKKPSWAIGGPEDPNALGPQTTTPGGSLYNSASGTVFGSTMFRSGSFVGATTATGTPRPMMISAASDAAAASLGNAATTTTTTNSNIYITGTPPPGTASSAPHHPAGRSPSSVGGLNISPTSSLEGGQSSSTPPLGNWLKDGAKHFHNSQGHLVRLERFLSLFQDMREMDARMRQDIADEVDAIKEVDRDLSSHLSDAQNGKLQATLELESQKVQRQREEERIKLQIEEQEMLLESMSHEKVVLDARLKLLTRLARETRESVGILRGRRKSYAEGIVTPSMQALLDTIAHADHWQKCLNAQRRCVAGSLSFLSGLEQEASQCCVSHLETEEESLTREAATSCESCGHLMDHQAQVIQLITDARGQLQGFADEHKETNGPFVVHYGKILTGLGDEVVRQAALAEDSMNLLEELRTTSMAEQLHGTADNLSRCLEHANSAYRMMTDLIDKQGIQLSTGGSMPQLPSSQDNSPRLPPSSGAATCTGTTSTPSTSGVTLTPPAGTPPSTPPAGGLGTPPIVPAHSSSPKTSGGAGGSPNQLPPSSGSTPIAKGKKLGLPTKLKSKRTKPIPRNPSQGSLEGEEGRESSSMLLSSSGTGSTVFADRQAAISMLPLNLQNFLADFGSPLLTATSTSMGAPGSSFLFQSRQETEGRQTPPSFEKLVSGESFGTFQT